MAKRETLTPGQAIEDAIEWLKMDKVEFAQRIGVSEGVLKALIDGSQPISRELASALESVTGSPAAYWKMLESKYRRSLSANAALSNG
ncbi:MAG: XRE family transcriptional regulator [Fibrobacteraceae bacterium]|nr:XRE family transcriptional regulator [Fibrobacteraceae bacterium]